ncbi:MAG TPA: permease [Thermoanaerobaculales bacterium]|nr:permease [Thermoanaerobaculales bacterium]HPA81199.1 permease [Thermoanaerobaculales bacterium]HQL29343.1 permease [Thermoanaerobaculales bacterium]HQN97591.1 permease [Thermoanaerobaculales bacterium]HQP43868.1 permease [Thermoanaerobaculales bacterium]
MDWKREWKVLLAMAAGFAVFYWLPVGFPRFDGAVTEALALTRWYAREHVLLCLVPAFFIAGAIASFVSQAAVMKYLGPRAPKLIAYGVASVSGTILAVCSCTVLPLFAGIHRMGAGLGPATAFLYSGPAINVLAIVLTASVLGAKLGAARAIGAVLFAVVVGALMAVIFRRSEENRVQATMALPEPDAVRPLAQTAAFFAAQVAVLVFANWARPEDPTGLWFAIWRAKWWLTAAGAAALGIILVRWFSLAPWKAVATAVPVAGLGLAVPQRPELAFVAGVLGLALVTARSEGELGEWFASSWGYAKQILPLLLGGVMVAGFLLGRPDHEGVIPSAWVAAALGGNGLGATLFAAVAGAFMYFATLTEVPIVQGLIGSGMGPGPALALLLAGPALSLPSMIVIASVIGWKKTSVYVGLVVVMATITGMIYGTFIA